MKTSLRFASLGYAGLAVAMAIMTALLVTGRAVAESQAASSIPNADGMQIYQHICRGCHMPDAAGAVGAGHYPALAKDPTLISRQYMALTILAGRRNMPAFGAKHALGFGGPPTVLSHAQIAAVTNYVRSHFGNHYKDTITAAEVAALEQSLP